MSKLSTRERSLLVALVFISLGLSYYLYIIQPTIAKQRDVRLAISQQQVEVAKLAVWEAKAVDLTAEVATLGLALQRSEAAIDGLPIPDMLAFLETSARLSGAIIHITSLQGIDTTSGGPVSMEVTGSYAAVYGFLARVEENPVFTVDQFRVVTQASALNVLINARVNSAPTEPRTTSDDNSTASPFGTR